MLKDTVDGDGVAELAAQSAAERPIGDLSAQELREKLGVYLSELYTFVNDARGMLEIGSVHGAFGKLQLAAELILLAKRQVRQ